MGAEEAAAGVGASNDRVVKGRVEVLGESQHNRRFQPGGELIQLYSRCRDMYVRLHASASECDVLFFKYLRRS